MLIERLTDPRPSSVKSEFCYLAHGFSKGTETPEDLVGRPVSATLVGRMKEPLIENFYTRGRWGIIFSISSDSRVLSATPSKSYQVLLKYNGHNTLLVVPDSIIGVFYSRGISVQAGEYSRRFGLPLVHLPKPRGLNRHTLADEDITLIIDKFIMQKTGAKIDDGIAEPSFRRYVEILDLRRAITPHYAARLHAKLTGATL